MVPRAKLFDRNAEAIGNGDQRIAAACGVALLPGGYAAYGGDRHDQFVAGLYGLTRCHIVELGDLRGVAM